MENKKSMYLKWEKEATVRNKKEENAHIYTHTINHAFFRECCMHLLIANLSHFVVKEIQVRKITVYLVTSKTLVSDYYLHFFLRKIILIN